MSSTDLYAINVLPVMTTRHCFALHNVAATNNCSNHLVAQPISCGTLSNHHCQDLANALPFLACGEESAIHAFSNSLLKHLNENQRAEMARIAEDELRHANWLERLRISLPLPNQHLPNKQLTRFFKRLLTRHTALHFARVAALDSAVCKLLAPLLRVDSILFCQAPEVHSGLVSILRDEARHVKAARKMASNFGLSKAKQTEVNTNIEAELWQLLTPVLPGLNRLARQKALNQ